MSPSAEAERAVRASGGRPMRSGKTSETFRVHGLLQRLGAGILVVKACARAHVTGPTPPRPKHSHRLRHAARPSGQCPPR